jgi:hypothetical protein
MNSKTPLEVKKALEPIRNQYKDMFLIDIGNLILLKS